MSGERYNIGKLRFDLLPPDAETELARVMTAGAEKYAARNWEKGLSWTETVGSLRRHLTAWLMGEELDPETGCRHLAHVAVNAIFLLTFALRNTGTDDRPRESFKCPDVEPCTLHKPKASSSCEAETAPFWPTEWGSGKRPSQWLLPAPSWKVGPPPRE